MNNASPPITMMPTNEMGQQPQPPVPFQPGELNLNLSAIVKSPLFWMTMGGFVVWYLMSKTPSGRRGD